MAGYHLSVNSFFSFFLVFLFFCFVFFHYEYDELEGPDPALDATCFLLCWGACSETLGAFRLTCRTPRIPAGVMKKGTDTSFCEGDLIKRAIRCLLSHVSITRLVQACAHVSPADTRALSPYSLRLALCNPYRGQALCAMCVCGSEW